MNNFRKIARDKERFAVDGILNAPKQPGKSGRSLGRRPAIGSGLRSSGRPVDGFKRAEGYHSASQPLQAASRANSGSSAQAVPGPSLLNMTLPGGERDKKEKRRKGKRNWRKIIKWSFISILILFLLAGGFLVAKGYLKLNKVFKGGSSAAGLQENVSPSLLKGEGDGRVNILLLGKGGEGHEAPDLTDTILLASVDPLNKTASLVSVPRDLWVKVPNRGSMKINAVYATAKNNSKEKDPKKAEQAGIDLAQEVVSQVLGVPIHYYGMLDFVAFRQAVDTLGGVTIDVPEDLVDHSMAWENKRNPVLAKQGLQTFDGKQALMYVRSRHGSARGDFDRTDRQRLFITALVQKILSAGTYTNPLKISQLIDDFGDHVSTDMGVNDALRLMTIAKGFGSNIGSVGLADPPHELVTTDNVNGQSVVRPRAGFGDYAAIHSLIRNQLKDGYIAKENALITVLNGAGIPGLATAKAEELKSYGYNVGIVGDAPTQAYAQTTIVDLTGGKKPYTANYLEQRFDTKTVSKLPDATILPENANFVIILGQNETINSQD